MTVELGGPPVPDEPVVPAPPPPDPAQILTPEQVQDLMVRAQRAVVIARELVKVIQLVEAHDFAGLLGELRAAFGALAARRPS